MVDMALRDLIVQKQDVTDELLEIVLEKYARLVDEEREVRLTPEAEGLLIKQKVLLYLAGMYAWDIIEEKKESTPINNSQIENSLKIEGNTLRPILKSFRDSGEIEQKDGGSIITYKGVETLKKIDEVKLEEKRKTKKEKDITNVSVSKSTSTGRETILKSFDNSTLDIKYVEKMLEILRNSQNIDKYLIALYIAKMEFGVDGLTPGEVNTFLTSPPFKLSRMFTTNISRDLGKNFKTKAWVNPYESAGKFGLVYRITSKGEKRIDELLTRT